MHALRKTPKPRLTPSPLPHEDVGMCLAYCHPAPRLLVSGGISFAAWPELVKLSLLPAELAGGAERGGAVVREACETFPPA
jgi:hypothetical protein